MGYIKQDFSLVYPWFTAENAEGEPVLKIKGPCWTCKFCDIEFQVCEFVYINSCIYTVYYTCVHALLHVFCSICFARVMQF